LTLCVSSQGAGGFGDAVEPEAVLDGRPDLVEGGAAQHRRDLMQHLREGEDFGRLVHQDDAACRVGGRVQPGDRGGHRVADHDRALDAQSPQEPVDLLGDVFRRRRFAAAAAVRRQVDRDARDGAVQLVDDRPPGAAVEGQPVHEDDRRPSPLHVVGQSGPRARRR
jgi:hypothetical protein